MSDKWTPGEWSATKNGDILAPDGLRTVTVARVGAFHDKEIVSFNRVRWAADARLIAAAPELYQALAFAASCIKSGEPWTAECERTISAALAKARGLA